MNNVVHYETVNTCLPRKNWFLALLVAACCLLAAMVPAHADLPGFPREKGAFYLEDFFNRPYRLRVLVDAPIYFNVDAARFLGTVRREQAVDLLAVTGNGALLRVRGQAQQGQVSGWIPARYLTPLDATFVEGLRRASERREQVRKLAVANEIALGMTVDEVGGHPRATVEEVPRTQMPEGTSETWEFTRFESVPRSVISTDPLGRVYTTVVYERVPVGSLRCDVRGRLGTRGGPDGQNGRQLSQSLAYQKPYRRRWCSSFRRRLRIVVLRAGIRVSNPNALCALFSGARIRGQPQLPATSS